MADIISYLQSFIPSQYSFLVYLIGGSVLLLALDSAFSLIVALTGRFFK